MNISFFLNPLDSHRSDIAKDIFIIPTEKIHTHRHTKFSIEKVLTLQKPVQINPR